jgi:DNA mismatch endonuclease (patch repair protein)
VADVYSKAKRSQIMASIRGIHTSPEILLAQLLKELGLKFERHRKDLPGSPDAVLPRKKIALFVNGCFWHGHHNCSRAALPSTNKVFWKTKIEKNKRRDESQRRKLRRMGWSVLTFWTCRSLTRAILESRLKQVISGDGCSADSSVSRVFSGPYICTGLLRHR